MVVLELHTLTVVRIVRRKVVILYSYIECLEKIFDQLNIFLVCLNLLFLVFQLKVNMTSFFPLIKIFFQCFKILLIQQLNLSLLSSIRICKELQVALLQIESFAFAILT
jgi:hypothetical protein